MVFRWLVVVNRYFSYNQSDLGDVSNILSSKYIFGVWTLILVLGEIFMSIEPREGYFSYNQSDLGDVSNLLSCKYMFGVWTLMLVLGEIFMSIEPWEG